MAVKKSTTKAQGGTKEVLALVFRVGNSIEAIRNLGEEFMNGDGEIKGETMTVVIDRMTAGMLKDVDAILVALGNASAAGYFTEEEVSHG